MEHLLNQCTYSSNLWDKVTQMACRLDRIRANITKTIAFWRIIAYKSDLVLNRVW